MQSLIVHNYVAEIIDARSVPYVYYDSAVTVDSNNYLIFGKPFSKTIFSRSSVSMYELNSTGLESLIAGNRITVKSPNGTRYRISVADGGTLAIQHFNKLIRPPLKVING
jgi:hypothetical protein